MEQTSQPQVTTEAEDRAVDTAFVSSDCQGILSLEGKGLGLEGFRERYFVLSPDGKLQYRKTTDKKPMGEIQLYSTTEVSFIGGYSKTHPFTFAISTQGVEDGHIFHLAADYEGGRGKWIDACQAFVASPLAKPPFLGEQLLRGWLWKAADGSTATKFQRRFFIAHPDRLQYFLEGNGSEEHQSSTPGGGSRWKSAMRGLTAKAQTKMKQLQGKPQGEIMLTADTTVRHDRLNSTRDFTMALQSTASSRQYRLACADQGDMDLWIQIIQDAVQVLAREAGRQGGGDVCTILGKAQDN